MSMINSNYRSASRRRRGVRGDGMRIAVGAAAVAALLAPVGWIVAWENAHETRTCTVREKDRTTNSEGGSDHRIYTYECGVLVVADDMWQGQWNSADTYSQIERGKTYNFETVGWRLGLLSLFPNAVSAIEVLEQ
jgi:hypothetical protein